MYFESDSTEVSSKKAVMGALTLYLDFINLFIMLLRLFRSETIIFKNPSSNNNVRLGFFFI